MIDLKDYQEQPDEGLYEKIQKRLAARSLVRSGFVAAGIVAVAIAVTVLWPVGEPVAPASKPSPFATTVDNQPLAQPTATELSDIQLDESEPVAAVRPNNPAVKQMTPVDKEPIATDQIVEERTVSPSTVAPVRQQPAVRQPVGSVATPATVAPAIASNPAVQSVDKVDNSNVADNENATEKEEASVSKAGTPVPHYDNIIWAPNVIVPDGDVDANRTFSIKATSAVSNFTLQIFNRRGMRIYSTNDPNFVWDATYDGAKVSQGAYVWVASFRDTEGRPRNEKGSVVVVR